MPLFSWLSFLVPPVSAVQLWRHQAMAHRVLRLAEPLRTLSDAELTIRGRLIRWEAQTGTPLATLLPDAFALVREASRRVLGMQHFPVQVVGGVALFAGGLAEMQTGEGKTLTAALPAFLHALRGLGCHVITTNDYLALRDRKLLGPVYERLGLTVGCIRSESTPAERRHAYAQDITYGTAKELGFDFLRDRLQRQPGVESVQELFGKSMFGSAASGTVQRGHHFALIDEADSILIDEARTPLVIGLTEPNDPGTVNLYRWCRRTIRELRPELDFVYEPEQRQADLTPAGCRKVLLMSKSSLLNAIDTERLYHHVEQALTADLGFRRDRDYVVVKDEVRIVDESTGRIMEGRKWQDGLHQSIEAKEHLPITAATGEAARVTMQTFFRQYTHVAGMTGTALAARRELHRIYGLDVMVIPTHRPCLRRGQPPRIFATQAAKRAALVEEIARRHATGQPLLVGTPSVAASEALGALLQQRGLRHQILHARAQDREAELIARAGDLGMVTIATNMAGRGTDIPITDAVRALGGLHVIATEMHSSRRIDRQLIGRAARQGDPGSYQFWLSLEDELLSCREPVFLARLRRQARPNASGQLSTRRWLPVFRRTQSFLERLHLRQRRDLLRQERQRAATYRQMGLDPCLELTET